MGAAKKKEISTLQKQIETEMTRIGNLGVSIAEMQNDQEDTEQALSEDQKFKLELKQSCATKSQDWEVTQKTRQEELLALAETIRVLNDDDALELFKKTLPSASFVQVQESTSAMKAKALEILRSANSPKLGFIELAINGQKGGFGKVIKMIDEMVANLKAEQEDDNQKKTYCEENFDKTDDEKKELEQKIADSDVAIEEMEGAIAQLR